MPSQFADADSWQARYRGNAPADPAARAAFILGQVQQRSADVANQYRNLLVKLFSAELILIGASLNFMAFARLFADAPGQLFAFLIIFVGTAEILVALAIVAAVLPRPLPIWWPSRPPRSSGSPGKIRTCAFAKRRGRPRKRPARRAGTKA